MTDSVLEGPKEGSASVSLPVPVTLYRNSGKSESKVLLGESWGVAAVCVIIGGENWEKVK